MFFHLKKFLKNNMMIIIVVVVLMYFGPAMYKPAQANEKAIATAMGIDKADGEFELSLLIIIPTAEKTDSANGVELVSAKGSSLGNAINAISLDIGKSVGLSHCDAVVLSDVVLQDDLRMTLDYLNRSGELTKNAIIFNTPQSSKDVLQTAISSKTVSAIKLSTMVEFNKEHAISKDASLDGFYAQYYTPSAVSLFPIIDAKESKNVVETQGQSEESQGGQNNKTLQCNGDICVVKNGKKVATLLGDDLSSYNVLKPNIKNAFVWIKDANGDGYKNADIMLEIRKKQVSKRASFEGSVPTIKYSVKLLFRAVEINNQNSDIQTLSEVETKITPVIKQKVVQSVKDSFEKIKAAAIEGNVDVFEFDNYFSAHQSKEWDEYKKYNPNPQDYLSKIDVQIELKIDGKF